MLTDDFYQDSVSRNRFEEDINTSNRLEAVTLCSVQTEGHCNKSVDENIYNISGNKESYLDSQHTDIINNAKKITLSNNEENSALNSAAYIMVSDPIESTKGFAISDDQFQDKQQQIALSLSHKERVEQNDRQQEALEMHLSKNKLETNNKTSTLIPSTTCIVCKKAARTDTIYCSDDCIRKHAQCAINQLANRAEVIAMQTSNTTVTGASTQNNSNIDNNNLQKVVCSDNIKKKPKELFKDVLALADRRPKLERVFLV